MGRIWTLLLITSMIYLVEASRTREKTRERERERERERDRSRSKDMSVSSYGRNPCKVQNPDGPVHCFCNDPLVGNASNIECWIFNKKLPPDFFLWNFFSTQPHIKRFRLLMRPGGNISYVPTKGLHYFKELEFLEILYADIHTIPPYAFANLTNLQVLKLERNAIFKIAPYSFANMPKLEEINLDDNKIYELTRDVFVNLSALQRLFITHNNLSAVEEGAFKYLTKLAELELNNNFIIVVTREMFTGLGELRILDMSSNKIKMLGDLTFAELWVLEELLLESNQIELVSEKAFVGMAHIKRIYLNNNKIKMLSPSLFTGILTINYLDFRSNHLTTMRKETIEPILPSLLKTTGYFNIEDNMFSCDCKLIWLYEIRNMSKNEEIINMLDELTCFLETTRNSTKRSKALEYNTTSNHAIYHVNHFEQNDAAYLQVQKVKVFFEIPTDELPCTPEEKPTEATVRNNIYTPFAEISSSTAALRLHLILIPLILLVKLF